MTSPQSLVVRTFTDRAEGLSHFVLRAGEAPRLLAFDDALGCPVETALAALEWTGAVGILLDDDLLHAARLTSETAAAVIERKGTDGRRFVYLGPRLDAPPMDVFEGAVLFDEPGVKAVEFTQRAHALAHFLRATAGAGALLALLGRRAPELRHLRRWLGPIIQELDVPRPLVAGWFAASSAGCLFGSLRARADLPLRGGRASSPETGLGFAGVDSHLHIVWTEPGRVSGRQGLGIHIPPSMKHRNPNKIRHLRDYRGCLF